MPPSVSPMCCEVRYNKNEALSFKEDGIMMSIGQGETDVTVVAMSVVIIILALALLVCIVNVCW